MVFKQLSRLMTTAAFACLAFAPAVYAEDKQEYPAVEKLWHGTFDVDKDGRVTETITTRIQVLQEKLLERLKVYSISYSSSIQTGEVLEAFTVKKDGREI